MTDRVSDCCSADTYSGTQGAWAIRICSECGERCLSHRLSPAERKARDWRQCADRLADALQMELNNDDGAQGAAESALEVYRRGCEND